MLKFNSPDKTRANELKALFFIEKNLLADAEEILIGNLKSQTESPLTYDLLIGIYERTRNYPLLISVLNSGIRRTAKRKFYRKLKKQIIISKLREDISSVN